MDLNSQYELAEHLYQLVGADGDMRKFHDVAMANPEYQRSIGIAVESKIQRGMSRRDASNLYLQSDQFLCQWARYGFNVFNTTHSLTAALLLTQPSQITTENWRPPFDAFIICIPDDFIAIRGGNKTQWCRYVRVSTYINGSSHIMVCGNSPEINGEDRAVEIGVQDQTDHFLSAIDGNTARAGDRLDAEDPTSLGLLKRLTVNFVSWMNATDGLNRHRPETRATNKNKENRDSKKRPTVWLIGKEVKISRELRDAAKDQALAANGNPHPEWKVKFRHVVRGHMKEQAHGSRMTLRKTVWIEPYWRGPEDGVAWSHAYKDKAPQP